MKTSLKNYFVQAGFLLIFLAAFLFGFSLYKVIAHKSSGFVAQSLLFLAVTIAIINQYRKKTKGE